MPIIEVLKPNLWEHNNFYILVKNDIADIAASATEVEFKNCSPVTKCITKIYGITIDDAEGLDLVMSMYNSIEYISNYLYSTGSLCFYSKDEAANFNANSENTNNFKYVTYKAGLLGNTVAQSNPYQANRIPENAAVVEPLII